MIHFKGEGMTRVLCLAVSPQAVATDWHAVDCDACQRRSGRPVWQRVSSGRYREMLTGVEVWRGSTYVIRVPARGPGRRGLVISRITYCASLAEAQHAAEAIEVPHALEMIAEDRSLAESEDADRGYRGWTRAQRIAWAEARRRRALEAFRVARREVEDANRALLRLSEPQSAETGPGVPEVGSALLSAPGPY